MREMIIFFTGIIVGLLFGAWLRWKRRRREIELSHKYHTCNRRKRFPIGAKAFAVACAICKYRDDTFSERCNRCQCEIESGFELDKQFGDKQIKCVDDATAILNQMTAKVRAYSEETNQ